MTPSIDRRDFVAYFAGLGLGSTLLPGVLWAQSGAGGGEITTAAIASAEEIAGLRFTEEQRKKIAEGLKRVRKDVDQLRAMPLGGTMPAVHFNPVLPGMKI